jgi:hypothetical protein
MCTLFLQLITFFTQGYILLRLVTLSQKLLYFLSYDLYTVSMTLVDATYNNLTVYTLHNPRSPLEFSRSLGSVTLGYVR